MQSSSVSETSDLPVDMQSYSVSETSDLLVFF